MRIASAVGDFAGDKDAAASMRENYIRSNLRRGLPVELDFAGVDLATQSFVHALLASVIREDPDNLASIEFKNCNESVKSIIQIVVEYAQDDFE